MMRRWDLSLVAEKSARERSSFRGTNPCGTERIVRVKTAPHTKKKHHDPIPIRR